MLKTLKILQVNPFFSPAHGGSARSSYDITKFLSQRNEVVFYTSNYKFSREWAESLPQVKVYPFTSLLNMNFFVTPALINKARKEIKHFDLVHLHNYRTYQNIVIAHYARKNHVPYIVQAHGSLPIMMDNRKTKKLFDTYFGLGILQNSAYVIALNRFEASQYVSMGVPRAKIQIIPNSVECPILPKLGQFKSRYGLAMDSKLVLYLGRIHKIKGLDVLVRAFARVVRNCDNTYLVIVGPDDGYLENVLSLVKLLHLEKNVLVTGPLYGERKLEAYVDSEIYVLPSTYECFPIGLVEACACSIPVIASNVGSVSEIINNGKTGFLVQPGNVEELANRMDSLLSNKKKFVEVGLRASRFVIDNFSNDKIFKKLENLYEDILLTSKSKEENT